MTVHGLVSLDIRSGPASNRLLLNLNVLMYITYQDKKNLIVSIIDKTNRGGLANDRTHETYV